MEREHKTARIALFAAVAIYVILFSALSITRYNNFDSYTFDQGILSQVVWNTSHGRWFETSLGRQANDQLVGSYLGNHVRPILLLLAPIYRVWPDPRLLLILQSVGLGLGAIPLYLIARRYRCPPSSAFICVVCYLAYPALGDINLFDFHPIAFSVPLLLLAQWALLEERNGLFWVAVVLAMFTKEEVVVPIAVWGAVNLLQPGRRRIGIGLLLIAAVWAVLCFGLIIPYFNDSQPYRFLRYWSFGAPGEAAELTAITRAVTGSEFLNVSGFVLYLLLPLGFILLLGPRSLVVALPSLAYLLLGGRTEYHSIGYQYPAILVPWFFVATVEGLQRLPSLVRRIPRLSVSRIALACMLGGTLGTNYLFNPIALHADRGAFLPNPQHNSVTSALQRIPPQAGVATINGLGAQLAHRRVLVALEDPPPLRLDHVALADYLLVDLVDCRAVAAANPRQEYADIIFQVLDTRLFRTAYWSDRILLMERGIPDEGELEAIRTYVSDLVERDQACWP